MCPLINDLPYLIRSTVKIFADDTKIFRAIHDPEDYSYLQDDLDRLVEWVTIMAGSFQRLQFVRYYTWETLTQVMATP